jgi:nicotinamide-nucleotide amidase
MLYSIIAIGDELLAGQVTDTNSGAIARMLEPYGWELHSVSVIGDSPAQMQSTIAATFAEVDAIITTGGLGPTKDDMTKQTLCHIFGGELKHDPAVLENVMQVVDRRGLKLNPLTAAQAMVPTSCRVIQNRVGTAPIMWFERDGKVLVAMPGVPFETLQMMEREVRAQLVERFPSDVALERRTVIVAGMSESNIAGMLAQWEDALPQYAHLAYLPKPGVVRLRLDGHHHDSAFLHAEMERLRTELIALIPPQNILATNDLTPEAILSEQLRRTGLKFATAESCTGGTIAQRITSLAGASEVFCGSVVAYANEVKTAALGVSPQDIAQHGAVSETVVRQMAEGARQRLGADVAVATSGIAGPGGGSAEKPVGTVWIAVATPQGVSASVHRFPGSRDRVIDRAATTALIQAAQLLMNLQQ